MEPITILSLIVAVALIIFAQYKFRPQTIQENSNDEFIDKINILTKEIGAKTERIKFLEEQLQEQRDNSTKQEEKLSKEFQNLANKILEENSTKFKHQNKEQLTNILDPLNLQLSKFEKQVRETNEKSIERNASLIQKINSLESLNNQLSQEAINLTNALKGDNKTQGDWGEMQLEVLLEKSGLTKDIHFSTQGGYRDEDGNLKKPDFIIHLPDNKHLIIDSKVSLKAYDTFCNSEDETTQKLALKKHVDSIKSHYQDLSNKDYPNLYNINAPDHVLMFVPIEPALLLALHESREIYLDAFGKNIVLVSASTLLATLSTVSSIWKQEDQKRNALEIAKEGGLLYDKFEGFLSDLLKIGANLNSSKTSYDEAMNKLTSGNGNILKKIENLKKLGAKTKKQLPQNIIDRANSDEDN
jgi:DNA recombination protein RmuC|tara:strand:+ start:14559 stop:15800 length:1242 start_codon:yes stop_codon:yes gene_type:complete